jgi:hypothetical protein
MPENDDVPVGKRFLEVSLRHFGTKAEAARRLKKTQSNLDLYFSGKVSITFDVEKRMLSAGITTEEMNFIKYGNKDPDDRKSDKKKDALVEFHAPGGINEESRKQIQKMINDLSELPAGDIERAREVIKAAFRKK